MAPHLLNTVCSDLLESTGKDVQLEAAHSMLCLQVGCTVGALVEVTRSGSSSNISQYLLPSDAATLMAVLTEKTAVLTEKDLTNGIVNTVWVVDHAVTAMQGAYPPYSIVVTQGPILHNLLRTTSKVPKIIIWATFCGILEQLG